MGTIQACVTIEKSGRKLGGFVGWFERTGNRVLYPIVSGKTAMAIKELTDRSDVRITFEKNKVNAYSFQQIDDKMVEQTFKLDIPFNSKAIRRAGVTKMVLEKGIGFKEIQEMFELLTTKSYKNTCKSLAKMNMVAETEGRVDSSWKGFENHIVNYLINNEKWAGVILSKDMQMKIMEFKDISREDKVRLLLRNCANSINKVAKQRRHIESHEEEFNVMGTTTVYEWIYEDCTDLKQVKSMRAAYVEEMKSIGVIIDNNDIYLALERVNWKLAQRLKDSD